MKTLVGYISVADFKPAYKTQHDVLLRAGVNPKRIWLDGREKFETFVGSLRPDDIVVLQWLVVLAKDGTRLRRRSLMDRLKAIIATGAEVLEQETGRSSADLTEYTEMVAEAVAWCASGRKPGEKRDKGRPRNDYTDKQLRQISKIWRSGAPVAKRVEAIQELDGLEGFSRSAGYALAREGRLEV